MFLLLADVEWMRWIGLIVFIVIYILNHFLGGDKKKAQAARAKAAGAKPPERTEQPAPPNRPAAPSPARRSQSQEVEAFLQRAKNRRRENTPPARPAAKAPAPPRRLAEAPVEAEVVKPRQLGAAIANKQIDTRDVTEHAEHLTDDLTQGDQTRELHRRKMFSRRVGSLEDTSGEMGAKAGEDAPQSNAAATAAAAVPLAAAFFRPEDIRQAIIVSEVLQRPEHRW